MILLSASCGLSYRPITLLVALQPWGLSLAAVTLPNIGGGVHPHGWLIVALGMNCMCQRSIAWMISAYPVRHDVLSVCTVLVVE